MATSNKSKAAVEPAAKQSDDDQRFMRRALALARRGGRATRPNPMVGAVVVHEGQIVAEGFHRRAGGPHAEAEALGRVGGRAPGATLYVTLEPCCHQGRTPPCTDAVLASGVSRVVVAVRDPNPLVDGGGIEALRRAGVRVDIGCLEPEGRELNRAFFVWIREKRPLVTLKIAASWDGLIADGRRRAERAPVWLTGPAARDEAHALRAAHDAVLVGGGTVRADDPRLTDRRAERRAGPQPVRVVVAGSLGISAGAAVLDGGAGKRGGTPALVFGARAASAERRARALRTAGAEVVLLPSRGREARIDLTRVLSELAAREIQSVLVEGGATIAGAFVRAGLVDRVAVFLAPRLLGGGVPIANAAVGRPVAEALKLGPARIRRIGDDLLLEADVVP